MIFTWELTQEVIPPGKQMVSFLQGHSRTEYQMHKGFMPKNKDRDSEETLGQYQNIWNENSEYRQTNMETILLAITLFLKCLYFFNKTQLKNQYQKPCL